MTKNFDYPPIKLRKRICRFCGKHGANFVPELGKGFSHLQCWKDYEATQQGVVRTGLYCSECGGLGNNHTVMCSEWGNHARRTRKPLGGLPEGVET